MKGGEWKGQAGSRQLQAQGYGIRMERWGTGPGSLKPRTRGSPFNSVFPAGLQTQLQSGSHLFGAGWPKVILCAVGLPASYVPRPTVSVVSSKESSQSRAGPWLSLALAGSGFARSAPPLHLAELLVPLWKSNLAHPVGESKI